MAKILDVRGDDDGPLLGRLRGVIARHEWRRVLNVGGGRIYGDDTSKAHFVFRREVPRPLPDLFSNDERQIVASAAAARALSAAVPSLTTFPVRLVDRSSGNDVAGEFVVVVVDVVENAIDGAGNGFVDGYYYNEVRYPKEPATTTPLFRNGYSLILVVNDDVARVVEQFCAPSSGVKLVELPRYTEIVGPRPPSGYQLLVCGTEGADLRLDGVAEDDVEEGKSLQASWPRTVTASMRPPKSRKKIVDFTTCQGAPVVTAKAKKVLEGFSTKGGGDVGEFLPVVVKDHGGKPVKGEHWLFHVTAVHDYVDIDESDIEVVHDLRWTAREIVVDERKAAGPPLFRVPGARYPWVFVRSDVVTALEQAKLTGFRTEHPGRYRYSVEGSGLRSVC